MTATNKEIIEQAYASFAAGDVPAALAAFADDIEWSEPDGYPLAGTYVGPQAVLQDVFMRLGEIGDHFAVVPERFVADGDTVVALGNISWKHKDTGAPRTPPRSGSSAERLERDHAGRSSTSSARGRAARERSTRIGDPAPVVIAPGDASSGACNACRIVSTTASGRSFCT
jgi:hypothetical protein